MSTDQNYTWTQYFRLLAGLGTQDEIRKYIHIRSFHREEAECRSCERWREKLFKSSPLIVFLRENINKLGGELDSSNVICKRCDTLARNANFASFSPEQGITLCQNHIYTYGQMEDKLAHEMVHAYDHLRFDYKRDNLRHRACTEIRAAMLSGECRWSREFFEEHQWTKFTGHFQTCVKEKALRSTRRHRLCEDDDHAKRVVNSVFESCFADTRPFDEIYK